MITMVAIDITDEQYRVMNEMRKEVRVGRKKTFEPFKDVMQRILDDLERYREAYVMPGKD